MKKICFILSVMVSIIVSCGNVYASETDEYFKVNNETTLKKCIDEENMCKMESDVEISNKLNVTKTLIFDLNGHTLEANSNAVIHGGMILVGRGGNLTVLDSSGNGKISSGSNDDVWAGIELVDDQNTDVVAKLTVDSGTIEGYYYGITGNGTRHNSSLTVNGGTIRGLNTEDSAGIFQPQKGTVIINGGKISGGTGIEIRSGNLTINAGEIEGLAKNFVKVVNRSGTTTNGVGVAIAQHTTQNDIDVNILNGTISGQYALYEWNPHANQAIDKVKLSIKNGDFTGYATGVLAVYSEDLTGFIHGGKFNTDVTKYLANDANVASKDTSKSPKKVETKKSFVPYIVIVVFVAIGILGALYYLKFR